MSIDTSNPYTDITTKFVFESADIRGETACLDLSYADALGTHDYPEPIARLLGEFIAAVTLLSTTIKFEGRLTLQATSPQGLSLVMAQCTSDREIRAIVRGADEVADYDFNSLLGGGQLSITIEPKEGQRYQGLVALSSDSLATALEAYFEQSEQLFTRLWLAADGQRCGGLLLQQLPVQMVKDPEERIRQWEHVCHLAATASTRDLLDLPMEELLYRLYHQERVRCFEPEAVAFKCNCSRQRSAEVISSLPRGELEEILMSDGFVAMHCEFCDTEYRFEEADIGRLFGDPQPGVIH